MTGEEEVEGLNGTGRDKSEGDENELEEEKAHSQVNHCSDRNCLQASSRSRNHGQQVQQEKSD